jgi:hypothetical protein
MTETSAIRTRIIRELLKDGLELVMIDEDIMNPLIQLSWVPTSEVRTPFHHSTSSAGPRASSRATFEEPPI